MAALLNEAVFREKLTKLSSTQQSIEQTSAWCQFHRTDARRVAEVWEDFFSKADQPKRLALVYLANDIIQNGRRKGPEFLTEFYKVMPRALRHMMGRADEKTRTAVNKVIRVWDERKVFGSSGSKTFHELVHEAAPSPAAPARPPMPAPAAAAAASGGNAGADYPAAGQLGEVLAAAAGAAARSAQLAGAVAVAVPQALSGGGQQQVAAARQAVQGQLAALQAEVGSRQAAAAQLRQLLTEQEAGIAAAASRLQSCSHQLTQLDARGSEMQAAAPAGPTQPPQQQQAQQQAQQAAVPAAAVPMWGAPSPTQQQAVHMQEEAQYDLYAAPPLQQYDEPAQHEQQQHAGDVAAGAAELADPDSEAASLAAALAQNQNSAEALLAALMKLPQEQQDGLGAELAGLLQPGAPAGGEANGGGEMGEGDDLYDPTDF